MGYKANRTVLALTFEDPDMEGLVVRVRRGTVAERMEYDTLTTDPEIFEWFPKVLVEWNVEDDNDEVLPLTADGLQALEPQTLTAILDAWMKAGRYVAAPLERPSSGGELFPEESIPMETLSPSLAS